MTNVKILEQAVSAADDVGNSEKARNLPMPSQVKLTAISGKLSGQCFAFTDRTTCLVGRSRDCQIQIPNTRRHIRISRHHCLLDINPPVIRVRDFGSLNGTYVNESLIGKRNKGQSAEDAQHECFPEQDLTDGDVLMICDVMFRVDINIPKMCHLCARELPSEDGGEGKFTSHLLCESCRAQSLPTESWVVPRRKRLQLRSLWSRRHC